MFLFLRGKYVMCITLNCTGWVNTHCLAIWYHIYHSMRLCSYPVLMWYIRKCVTVKANHLSVIGKIHVNGDTSFLYNNFSLFIKKQKKSFNMLTSIHKWAGEYRFQGLPVYNVFICVNFELLPINLLYLHLIWRTL